MYKYKVPFYLVEDDKVVNCEYYVRDVQNAWQAALYVSGKFGDKARIDHDNIVRIYEM